MADRETHATNEFCFFCASDNLLLEGVGAALDGTPYTGPTVWMQKPMSFCPRVTPEELAEDEAERKATGEARRG